jgi:hypothetical protein
VLISCDGKEARTSGGGTVFVLNIRTGSKNKVDFGMLAATLPFLLVDHHVSRASRGNQESVAIDLQGGSALHHAVQGAERVVLAGEVEARYLPGRNPRKQRDGPDIAKRPGEQLFSPVQDLETRPFQLIRSSGKVPLTVSVRRPAEGAPPVLFSSLSRSQDLMLRRSRCVWIPPLHGRASLPQMDRRDQAESGSLLRRTCTGRERWILSNSLTSASPTSVAATPPLPARAVRPMRCT